MTEPTKEFPIRRYLKGRVAETSDIVVVEEPLEIRLGAEPFQVLMRLPGLEIKPGSGAAHQARCLRALALC